MALLSSFVKKTAKEIKDWYVSRGYPESVAERIASGDLPMDYESRMSRASQRFDVDNPEYTGSADLIGDINTPIWSAQNPSLAATYANPGKGGNITPVLLDREGVSTVRADGSRWNNINDSGRSTDDYMRKAQEYGLPSVAFRDIRDVGPYTARYPRDLLEQAFEPSNTTVTLDPNKIRSVNAAFDPEYTGPNILGTTAATAGALGLLTAPEDAEAGPSSIIKSLVKAADDISYRGSHTAPDEDYSAPFYDLTQMIPEDVYGPKGSRLYGFGDPEVDRQTFEALKYAQNNPDAMIDVYRAVPPEIDQLYSGDWVTPSRKYAEIHGESALNDKYNIVQSTVPARSLLSEGYPYELGISPNYQSGTADPGLLAATAAGGTGATLAAAQPSYIDQAFNAIDMPYKGYLGLSRLGGGLLAGEGLDTALGEAVKQIRQPIEDTAMQSGDAVLKKTGSPAAATLWNLIMQMGSPI